MYVKSTCYNFLVSSTYLTYVGNGTSCKATRKLEYALEKMIHTCTKIFKFHIRMPISTFSYGLSLHCYYRTWKHDAYSNSVAVPNIVKIGTIFPAHHLDNFEHIEKKLIVEASNNTKLKLAKCSISTSKWYALWKFNEPMCIVVQWNGAKEAHT